MGIKLATKILVIYQSQEVPIPSEQGEILRLYCFSLRYSNRRKANQNYL